jgi:general secretion pathway protein G
MPLGRRRLRCRHAAARGRARRGRQAGHTLIELVAALAVVGTIFAIFLPEFLDTLRRRKLDRAVIDIRVLAAQIKLYHSMHEQTTYPDSLADLEIPPAIDPWGQPYVYLRIEGHNRGAWRKDRFLVPLNSDFDLYSKGPDGKSRPPLTAASSRDDIVRAANGAYVGNAEDY